MRLMSFPSMLPRAALLAAAALGLGACPKAGTESATTATAAPSPTWWMSVKDGQLHRGLDDAPIGLYVGGDREGERFSPGGDIEGSGPIGAAGDPVVLELSSGRFVAATEPRPPPPYVEGALTPTGFSPKSRKVVY